MYLWGYSLGLIFTAEVNEGSIQMHDCLFCGLSFSDNICCKICSVNVGLCATLMHICTCVWYASFLTQHFIRFQVLITRNVYCRRVPSTTSDVRWENLQWHFVRSWQHVHCQVMPVHHNNWRAKTDEWVMGVGFFSWWKLCESLEWSVSVWPVGCGRNLKTGIFVPFFVCVKIPSEIFPVLHDNNLPLNFTFLHLDIVSRSQWQKSQ